MHAIASPRAFAECDEIRVILLHGPNRFCVALVVIEVPGLEKVKEHIAVGVISRNAVAGRTLSGRRPRTETMCHDRMQGEGLVGIADRSLEVGGVVALFGSEGQVCFGEEVIRGTLADTARLGMVLELL